MNKMPLRVDVAINLLKIKKNVFCDEVVTVLKKIRPTWFKDDQAIPSTLKAKVRCSTVILVPLIIIILQHENCCYRYSALSIHGKKTVTSLKISKIK